MKSGSVWLGTHRVSNWLAANLLFLATAWLVLWQNSQIAVLWDLSYLLDTSWRIALGQVPYRDFPLAHPPLTFLIQAARRRNIRWVIVKTRLQSNENPLPERERTLALIKNEFQLYTRLMGYEVYRR